MNRTDYTPGPWASQAASSDQGLIYSEKTGANVAVSYRPEDAPLIAAAPEMAAALDRCERALRAHLASPDTLAGRECLAAMNAARTALAAAGMPG